MINFHLVTALYIALFLGLFYVMAAFECEQKWRGSTVQSDYSLLGGCRVNVHGNGWVPEKNYRMFRETDQE